MNVQTLRRMLARGSLALGTIATSVLGAGAVGCASAPVAHVDGRVASGGGYLGDWDIYPDRCTRTGESIVLDRAGDGQRKLRLIDLTAGTSTALAKVELRLDDVTAAGPLEVVVSDASCVTTSSEQRGKDHVNEIKVDCTTGEGGHVVGTLVLSNCR